MCRDTYQATLTLQNKKLIQMDNPATLNCNLHFVPVVDNGNNTL